VIVSSPTTSRRCRRTGTAGSSTTARRSRTGDVYELAEVVRNLASGSGRRAFPQARSRCTRVPKKILASEFHVPLDKDEDAPRPTWTSCWRSASAPQSDRLARARPSASAVIRGRAPGRGSEPVARGFVSSPGRSMLEWSHRRFPCRGHDSPRSVVAAPPRGRSCAEQGVSPWRAGNIAPESVAKASRSVPRSSLVVHRRGPAHVTPRSDRRDGEELAARRARPACRRTPVTIASIRPGVTMAGPAS